jgi:hypothetical protein
VNGVVVVKIVAVTSASVGDTTTMLAGTVTPMHEHADKYFDEPPHISAYQGGSGTLEGYRFARGGMKSEDIIVSITVVVGKISTSEIPV